MGFVQIGYLAALAAVAVPVIIHLIRLRKASPVDLGTLRFLRRILERNVRRRRLKRWMLLALRIAAVSLLALLFARPYLLAPETTGSDLAVAILIDGSASMSLEEEGEPIFRRAVSRAISILERCGPEARAAIAFFDGRVHPLSVPGLLDDDPTSTEAILREPLEALLSRAPSAGATDYGLAVAWGRDVLAHSDLPRKRLVLLTDLQRSGLLRSPAVKLSSDVTLRVIDVGRPYVKNVAIARVAAPGWTLRPGEGLELVASVRSFGPVGFDGLPVSLHLRRGSERRDIQEEIRVPGDSTVDIPFRLDDLGEGLWIGYVAAQAADDLPFDDIRHVAVLVAPPHPIGLVDGDPRGEPLLGETYYLEMALRLAPRGRTYPASPFEPHTRPLTAGGGLPALDGLAAVVLANVGSVSEPDARRLAAFVREGGGLVIICGDRVEADGYRDLAVAGIDAGTILGPRPMDVVPWRLEGWEDDHPVLRAFEDPEHGDLRSLAFRSITGIAPHDRSKVVARFQEGIPALLETTLGKGKVLWLTTSCGLQWSDLPRSRLFLPLVHEILRYLVGVSQGGRVRQVPVDELPPGSGASEVGVHDRGTHWDVVNPDPGESDPSRSTPWELAARFGAEAPAEGEADAEAPALPGATDLRPDEIWHLVLLVLMGMLIAEVLLANRSTA